MDKSFNNAVDVTGVALLAAWFINDGLPAFILIISAVVVVARAYNEIMTAIANRRARRAAKVAA